jgi:hypothetical protein
VGIFLFYVFWNVGDDGDGLLMEEELLKIWEKIKNSCEKHDSIPGKECFWCELGKRINERSS